ncbi:hypothetical protein [Candidatus Nitrosocosmicus franklandus]|uniref:Uncharacterized protein n=1 Tax=Candidatus Nitrosocosmicus franklandianus TaxID=1798806 RepID=A0A484I8J9_9ARCH|nr:hypothetical protein [Candidatus Nitrosocosmicus franklandus]VFJ13132.1 conserved protein of unknown function [Candidatus Nitrosocosmicus franklandus]
MIDHSSCDPRVKAYKNGKTFDQCRTEARALVTKLINESVTSTNAVTTATNDNKEITWNQILEIANHDEIVYKLILKYFRQMGYDIGNYKRPRVVKLDSGNK